MQRKKGKGMTVCSHRVISSLFVPGMVLIMVLKQMKNINGKSVGNEQERFRIRKGVCGSYLFFENDS